MKCKFIFTKGILAAAFFLMPLVAYATTQEDRERDIKAFCFHEWEEDYAMQKHCRERQLEALRKVQKFKDRHLGELATTESVKGNPYATILSKCLHQWKKGDFTDWSMVNHCAERQSDAYQSLQQ